MSSAAWSREHRGPLTVTDDFAVLDDPVEQAAFTQAVDGADASRESVLVVQGMYCAACADTIESALDGAPGVELARVNAGTRRLQLRWDPSRTRLSELAARVGDRGYRLLPLQQALSIDERLRETRQALWRLFVAGFCMMQVMMYAWPAYVAAPGDIPPDIDQLLRWASWVISLPVVFFASGPFFRQAWADLKVRRIGMDTPVSVGILITFLASSAATFDPTGPWGHEVWYDSLTMFVFFLLGGRYLEARLRQRTAGALDALINRLPATCERERADGTRETVSVRRLAAGDVVCVRAGEAFPGDGVLLDPRASVDEALLTGEARPQTRRAGDPLVAGSLNLAGPVRLRLDRVGIDTRYAQIVRLMERAATDKPRLAVLADRIAGPFLVLVMLAALAAAFAWWQVDPSRALAIAVAVLIVTCPCALSLATPAAMLASAGALARRGVLVRRLQALESMASVNAVVFDKTGTLTREHLMLNEVLLRQGADRAQVLALAAALARGSLHPVARAVAAAATPSDEPLLDWHEEPGQGMSARLSNGRLLKLGSPLFTGAMPEHDAEGPRTYLVDEHGWLATITLSEGLREDARVAVQRLRALGMQTWLLSGDRASQAHRIGTAAGVDHVLADATPERKLAEVQALQRQGWRVAMVGDGLNDGPVLAWADASFTIGRAAPLAQARSDAVVQGGRVMDVVDTLLQARRTRRVVRQNLLWAAVYNAVCVPLALIGWMPPWLAGLGMAASSLLVIGNAWRLSRPEAAPKG
ncbi:MULTISPECIES: heavy metal translocating P-type ATPase [Hydrogenophaga]|jgi:Cu2+-exporting ATPase|uniref:Heavy metal translocating P-type ATPase n=1 Tax=Hydrogenophaga intermedia TaxID=65786 RepID=A0A1L1P9C5_HYDIT|nr:MULTISPECIES: cation-translocating P-type ATPase [Hydrogenophaga]AOS79686.1 ATPase P [Hydrogenophaga sp. PBC]TMU77233.1 cadmium-translocating P-type ATPase [Hydrogenophaga intermedia]CDN86442.1 Heavy metal translocating P-type ATPase [Hydrogenophaga intermedia]